jgi:membrane-bound lytic murein transglycosylase D
LYSIARAYGLRTSDLTSRNGLAEGDPLNEGQVLRTGPPATAGKDIRAVVEYHEVLPTDTLYGIARAYGITVSELMEWNGKTDFNISVGDRLRVRPKTD